MSENPYKNGYHSQAAQSFQSPSQSAYWSDQPKPSRGYVAFFVGFSIFVFFMLFSSLVPIFLARDVQTSAFILEIVILASIFLFYSVIFGLLLRTGYKIKYVLDEYTFHLYVGSRATFSIPLHQISQARKVAYVRRLMGWGMGGTGLSNRFRNGICLTITKGHKSRNLYITPTNPDEFLEHFNRYKER